MEMITRLLPQMIADARFLNDQHCALHLYRPDDLLVMPDTLPQTNEEPVLIRTQNLGSDLAIDVLVGTVEFVSVRHPGGFQMKKGFRYRLKGSEPEKLDCQQILGTASVQAFLLDKNWSPSGEPVDPGLTDQLQSYRDNFCQSAKPASQSPDWPIRIDIPIGPCWFGNCPQRPKNSDRNNSDGRDSSRSPRPR